MLFKSIDLKSDIEEEESLSRLQDFGEVFNKLLKDLSNAALEKEDIGLTQRQLLSILIAVMYNASEFCQKDLLMIKKTAGELMKQFAEIDVEQEAIDLIEEEKKDYERTLQELCQDIVKQTDDPLKALDIIQNQIENQMSFIKNHFLKLNDNLNLEIDSENCIKIKETAIQKIERDSAKQGGSKKCFENLKDIIRCRVTLSSKQDLVKVIDYFQENHDILQVKNGLNRKQVPTVYIIYKLKDENSLPPVEFQILQKDRNHHIHDFYNLERFENSKDLQYWLIINVSKMYPNIKLQIPNETSAVNVTPNQSNPTSIPQNNDNALDIKIDILTEIPAKSKPKDTKQQKKILTEGMFKWITKDGRGFKLGQDSQDATQGRRGFSVQQCPPEVAITVQFTKCNAIQVIAGHHTLGLNLDLWYQKRENGNGLSFTTWNEEFFPFELNVNDMTLSPTECNQSLVIGWNNNRIELVPRNSPNQICFKKVEKQDKKQDESKSKPKDTKEQKNILTKGMFKWVTKDGRGFKLGQDSQDALWGNRGYTVQQCSPEEAITVQFTKCKAIQIFRGHHHLGLNLTLRDGKRENGNWLGFTTWNEEFFPFELNVYDMTLSPTECNQSLVIGWNNYTLELVPRNSPNQICFKKIKETDKEKIKEANIPSKKACCQLI